MNLFYTLVAVANLNIFCFVKQYNKKIYTCCTHKISTAISF